MNKLHVNSGIISGMVAGAVLLMIFLSASYAHAAPIYEWVQIPSNTHPDITAKFLNCSAWGGIVDDVWACNRNGEGMIVRMYNPLSVSDRIGQGWNESFNAGRNIITYSRWQDCQRAGGADAGPGHRVYECKNVGDPEPPPPAPPTYQWVKIGGRPAFQPDMRGQYTPVNFKAYWPCASTTAQTLTCDASIKDKIAVAEYKATGFIVLADRGSFFQGFGGFQWPDPTLLALSGFDEATCSGAPSYLGRLGKGYNRWDSWKCTEVIPPTWSVSLSATPSSGQAPLSGVQLSSTGTGTATGSVRWQFDCDGNGTWESDVLSALASGSYTCPAYTVPGTYDAKVRSTRDGIIAEITAPVAVSEPPPVVSITANNFCGSGSGGTVDWSYVGIASQSFYQVQIYSSAVPSSGSLEFDSGKQPYLGVSTVTAVQGQPGSFLPGGTYFARVKAWNTVGIPSLWSSPMYTFAHPPEVDFSVNPDPPFALSPFTVTDTSVYGAPPISWDWDMGDGTLYSGQPSEQHTYADEMPRDITLTVSSADGTCSLVKSFTVEQALPFFKEVLPK